MHDPAGAGRERNLPIADLVAEAERIAAGGRREIVDGDQYGRFRQNDRRAVRRFAAGARRRAGIDRYRISSIEPNLLSDEVIAFTAASEKFQPHFHIPIQSGCDRILGLMRRRYNTAKFAERIEACGAPCPMPLGIDVIVGFPGETDDDFARTYDFLERIAPAFLHVFPYPSVPVLRRPICPDVFRLR
ncbi:MAG: radical SAM protein [Alistipes sp.]